MTLQQRAQLLCQHSLYFRQLMASSSAQAQAALYQDIDTAALPHHQEPWIQPCDSQQISVCMKHLRQQKQQAMRHFIWWELGIHGDIRDSYHAISLFAEGILQQALEMAERLIEARYGRIPQGEFCIIGLGKLGGHELNLGSDIDPLFVYRAHEKSQGGRQSLNAKDYYQQLCRMLIRLMSERTEHGMVWPIDMRLRPGGDGAPLCLSLDASLSHYLEYGQTWERAMLLKARPVAGQQKLGQDLLDGLQNFLYRRYLDYTCVAALADMKQRINQQAGQHKIEAGFDVKRGHGGIREIEFTIQALQLVYGHRSAELRHCEGERALYALQKGKLFPEHEAKVLLQAYRFWRRIEHALQARQGEQTHQLCTGYEAYLQAVLDDDNIQQRMQKHSQQVFELFSKHILPTAALATQNLPWQQQLNCQDSKQQQQIRRALQQIERDQRRGLLPERCHQHIQHILNTAMPQWLQHRHGIQAINAFAELLHHIAGRANWIDLLATHTGVLQWLIGSLSASRYISQHLAKNPSWLEWPLSHEQGATDIDFLCSNIRQLDGRDEEHFLAQLGKNIDHARLQSALAINAQQADPLVIGCWLADIADAAVQACQQSCLQQLQLDSDFPFVALAMGKHGSREMGLVSDLDMVFIFTGDAQQQIGKRSLREWAQRLGRRMIQQLSNRPPFGAGYEFDARLRPSGHSGVLVSSLQGFADYQQQEAQTWEHQALCRARTVSGNPKQQQKLSKIIEQILYQKRDAKALAKDLKQMRQKIIQHLGSTKSDCINLKHDAGGLIDIEFLAQYARLMFHTEHRGTVQSFQQLPDTAPQHWHEHKDFLAQTYLHYRQMENTLRTELWQSIKQLSHAEEAKEWQCLKQYCAIQQPQQLSSTMHQVHDCFQQLLSS